MNCNHRVQRKCRGASLIEMMGCLLAIVVGLTAGAVYLDLDIKTAWQVALARVGIASVQEPATESGARGEKPPHAAASREGQPAPPAQVEDPAQVEYSVLVDPTGEKDPHVAGGTPSDRSGRGPAGKGGTGAQSAGEKTLAYWSRLRTIILREQQSRLDNAGETAGNTRAALSARGAAFRSAVQAIRDLEADGVEPEVVQLGQEIAQWYLRGVELSDEGAYLLDEADFAAAQSPIGRRWHTAEKQHQEELDLLRRKSHSQQSKLEAEYRLPVPDLL